METVSKAIQERFLDEVKNLKIKFPVAEISKKTGYKSPIVSEYLSGKKDVSDKFLQKFCEVYNLNYTAIAKGNDLTLADFLRQYQERVQKPGGGTLSRRELAGMLGADIGSDNIVKWEMRGTIPREEIHRQALREFFGIEDLNAPTSEELENAIKAYPKGVNKTNKSVNTSEKKYNQDFNNSEHIGTGFGDNNSSNQHPDDMIGQLMHLMQQQNQIADKTASALDKFGDAYKSMASSMEILIGERNLERQGLKRTGS